MLSNYVDDDGQDNVVRRTYKGRVIHMKQRTGWPEGIKDLRTLVHKPQGKDIIYVCQCMTLRARQAENQFVLGLH